MQNEAIRLSIKFFEVIKGFKKDARGRIVAKDNYKMKVMQSIQSLLEGGMESSKLEELIDSFAEENPKASEAYNIDDVLKYYKIKGKKGTIQQDKDNLIKPGRFYFHPQLQVAPPAPVVELLPDGTFKTSYDEESFFLESKDRYTLEDLTNYFYGKMEIYKNRNLKRDKAAFEYLLRNYDLDVIMFTIGESRVIAEDLNKPIPKHPFEIEQYIEDGIAVLEARKNTLYMEGMDHVIPKSK